MFFLVIWNSSNKRCIGGDIRGSAYSSKYGNIEQCLGWELQRFNLMSKIMWCQEAVLAMISSSSKKINLNFRNALGNVTAFVLALIVVFIKFRCGNKLHKTRTQGWYQIAFFLFIHSLQFSLTCCLILGQYYIIHCHPWRSFIFHDQSAISWYLSGQPLVIIYRNGSVWLYGCVGLCTAM